MANPLTHDLTIKFSWNPNDKSTGGKEKSKKEFNPNILSYICSEKLRKECNLLEMSVG